MKTILPAFAFALTATIATPCWKLFAHAHDATECFKIRAPVNISFIKYWGKRQESRNLPTKDSFGVSLSEIYTETTIRTNESSVDHITVHDEPTSAQKTALGIQAYLNLFRDETGCNRHFDVETQNHFPTASGLASSSSGFSALAAGLTRACHLNYDDSKISILARLGSGSAARATQDGFVRFYRGSKDDGSDSFAETLFEPDYWPEFRMIVAVTTLSAKSISTRESGKQLVKNPRYQTWSSDSHHRVDEAVAAVRQKDLTHLGELTETDWNELQDVLSSCVPPIKYATEVTSKVIQAVKTLREMGTECYFTTDAGPHVKVLSTEANSERIASTLKQITGVEAVIVSKIGRGAAHQVSECDAEVSR